MYKMLIFFLLNTIRLDSDDDKDELLRQFTGVDIKIFFSAYSHYHLAVKTKGDRREPPFVAVNKYIDMETYGTNDMAKLSANGDGYEITFAKDMMCQRKNKDIVKCESEDTDTVWKIVPVSFGYTIQKNNKCLTKSDTEIVKLSKCTGDDDQKVDFKKYVGMDKCDEALHSKKNQDKNEKDANDNSNINIKLIPPLYGFPGIPYYDHMQPLHQPEIYSNMYGYVNEPVQNHNDIPHVHVAGNTEPTKHQLQDVKIAETRVFPVAETKILPVVEPHKPKNADNSAKDNPSKQKSIETNKQKAKYKLFCGLNDDGTNESCDTKAQKPT